eukprot:TRINITY_DN385_c0_g3_i2.p1 TRINITY_DN385_c0_g3~~TRINITY_DN385_c0_g3_i2.p1  ORF type:complete len:211 (-),score=31.30 TRINITY_DN385_c0_g3_i2:132-764(-)
MKSKDVKGSKYLLLVGGFSESEILEQYLKTHVPPQLKVILPKRPTYAIVQGAVLFGINPSVITVRKAKYTYGCSLALPWETVDGFGRLMLLEDGRCLCLRFEIFVRKGEDVSLNHVVERGGVPMLANQKSSRTRFFTSTKENPRYIDEEGSVKIGSLEMQLPGSDTVDERGVKVEMKFGGTEIFATVRTHKDNRKVKTILDFQMTNQNII